MSTKLRPQQLRVRLNDPKGIQFQKDGGADAHFVDLGDCDEATLLQVLRAIIAEMKSMKGSATYEDAEDGSPRIVDERWLVDTSVTDAEIFKIFDGTRLEVIEKEGDAALELKVSIEDAKVLLTKLADGYQAKLDAGVADEASMLLDDTGSTQKVEAKLTAAESHVEAKNETLARIEAKKNDDQYAKMESRASVGSSLEQAAGNAGFDAIAGVDESGNNVAGTEALVVSGGETAKAIFQAKEGDADLSMTDGAAAAKTFAVGLDADSMFKLDTEDGKGIEFNQDTNLFSVRDDLDVANDADIGNDLTVVRDAGIGGDLGVTGESDFTGDVRMASKLSVNGASGAYIANDLDVDGGADILEDLTVNGKLHVKGASGAEIDHDLQVDGDLDVTGESDFDDLVTIGVHGATGEVDKHILDVHGESRFHGDVKLWGSESDDPDFMILPQVPGASGQSDTDAIFRVNSYGSVTGAADVHITGNLYVSDKLTVTGDLTFVDSEHLQVEDALIVIAKGDDGSLLANTGAGIEIEDGASGGVNHKFLFDGASGSREWKLKDANEAFENLRLHDLYAGGALDVDATSTLDGVVTMGSDASVAGKLHVTGTSGTEIDYDLQVDGALTVGGNSTLGDSATDDTLSVTALEASFTLGTSGLSVASAGAVSVGATGNISLDATSLLDFEGATVEIDSLSGDLDLSSGASGSFAAVGNLDLSASVAVDISAGNAGSFKATAGDLVIDSEVGGLDLDGASVDIDSDTGSVDILAANAGSFKATAGNLVFDSEVGILDLDGNSVTIDAEEGMVLTAGPTGGLTISDHGEDAYDWSAAGDKEQFDLHFPNMTIIQALIDANDGSGSMECAFEIINADLTYDDSVTGSCEFDIVDMHDEDTPAGDWELFQPAELKAGQVLNRICKTDGSDDNDVKAFVNGSRLVRDKDYVLSTDRTSIQFKMDLMKCDIVVVEMTASELS